MTIQCPKCGKELQDTARFCTGCGAPVNSTEQPEAAVLQKAAETKPENGALSYNFKVSVVAAAAVLGCIAIMAVQMGKVKEIDKLTARASEPAAEQPTAQTANEGQEGFVIDDSKPAAEPQEETSPQEAEEECYEPKPQGSLHQLYSTPMVIGIAEGKVNIREAPSMNAKVVKQVGDVAFDLYESVADDKGKQWFHCVLTEINGKQLDPPLEGWISRSVVYIDYDYNAIAINKRTDIVD